MPDGSTVLYGAISKESSLSTEDKRSVRAFARELSRRLGAGTAFTCLITNDEELRRLNWQFLAHDYPTDVLSFPAATDAEGLGEIAISADRARAQAQEMGHTHVEEIQLLMLHGMLHLRGMDHERDRGEMARAEEHWRAELGLPGGLIARATARRG